MRKQQSDSSTANSSSLVEKRKASFYLNDVFNFIRNANRTEKRVIYLAMHQNNKVCIQIKYLN